MTAELKFCINCRWYRTVSSGHNWWEECTQPTTIERSPPNLVSGKITTTYANPSTLRLEEGICGVEGRLWEEYIPLGDRWPLNWFKR